MATERPYARIIKFHFFPREDRQWEALSYDGTISLHSDTYQALIDDIPAALRRDFESRSMDVLPFKTACDAMWVVTERAHLESLLENDRE